MRPESTMISLAMWRPSLHHAASYVPRWLLHKNQLVHQLCWISVWRDEPDELSKQYIAPSWCWASSNYHIDPSRAFTRLGDKPSKVYLLSKRCLSCHSALRTGILSLVPGQRCFRADQYAVEITSKTYSSDYSHVVTHCSTNPPVRSLSSGERTGSSILCGLWPYVVGEEMQNIQVCWPRSRLISPNCTAPEVSKPVSESSQLYIHISLH